MKALFASLTVLVVLGALVVAPVMAQTGGAKTIEGKVLAVDPMGKSLTLDDGTKLTIPESVKISSGDLKPGTAVKAAYEERDGQKILTNLEITK